MATTVYYRLGDVAILIATFTDASGDPVDPGTAVKFTLTKPDGDVTTYTHGSNAELVKDSTGVYYVAWLTALRGPYEWDITGTGTNAGSTGGKFRVH